MTAITTTAYECNNYAVITTTACYCSGGRGGVGGRVYADLGYNTSTLNNYLYITQFTTACTLHTLKLIVCYTLYDYLYTTNYTTTCIKSVAAGAGMGGRVYADLGADDLFKRAQVAPQLKAHSGAPICALRVVFVPKLTGSYRGPGRSTYEKYVKQGRSGGGGDVYADHGADELFKRAQVSHSLALCLYISLSLSLSLSLFLSFPLSLARSLSRSLALSLSHLLCRGSTKPKT